MQVFWYFLKHLSDLSISLRIQTHTFTHFLRDRHNLLAMRVHLGVGGRHCQRAVGERNELDTAEIDIFELHVTAFRLLARSEPDSRRNQRKSKHN